MAKKRKKKKSFGIIGYVAIFAVVATIAIVTWVRGTTLQAQIDSYDAQIELVNQKIENEQQRAVDIEDEKLRMQTKQYIEEIARKIGLVYEDEIVYKPSGK